MRGIYSAAGRRQSRRYACSMFNQSASRWLEPLPDTAGSVGNCAHHPGSGDSWPEPAITSHSQVSVAAPVHRQRFISSAEDTAPPVSTPFQEPAAASPQASTSRLHSARLIPSTITAGLALISGCVRSRGRYRHRYRSESTVIIRFLVDRIPTLSEFRRHGHDAVQPTQSMEVRDTSNRS